MVKLEKGTDGVQNADPRSTRCTVRTADLGGTIQFLTTLHEEKGD
jgi:hypothetical protein